MENKKLVILVASFIAVIGLGVGGYLIYDNYKEGADKKKRIADAKKKGEGGSTSTTTDTPAAAPVSESTMDQLLNYIKQQTGGVTVTKEGGGGTTPKPPPAPKRANTDTWANDLGKVYKVGMLVNIKGTPFNTSIPQKIWKLAADGKTQVLQLSVPDSMAKNFGSIDSVYADGKTVRLVPSLASKSKGWNGSYYMVGINQLA